MRYIGGKSKMLGNISNVIKEKTKDVVSVADFFSGSGVVSEFFKKEGYEVHSNDFLFFAYVLNRGYLSIDKTVKFDKLGLKSPIDYLNDLTLEESGFRIEDCYIFNNYSKHDKCDRMYFQYYNAIKIDIIRMKIEEWRVYGLLNDDEYYYLLKSLISAVPYISNITGVYGAYLKFWDKRTYNDLKLIDSDIIITGKSFYSYNADSNDLAREISVDLAYLDPPYNSRQYLPNYHILETIARYDRPLIKGVTGMRDYGDMKSSYCQKRLAEDSFIDMISNLKSRYVIVSYSTDGIIKKDRMMEILSDYSNGNTCDFYDYDYGRYNNKIALGNNNLKEQLYFIERAL